MLVRHVSLIFFRSRELESFFGGIRRQELRNGKKLRKKRTCRAKIAQRRAGANLRIDLSEPGRHCEVVGVGRALLAFDKFRGVDGIPILILLTGLVESRVTVLSFHGRHFPNVR